MGKIKLILALAVVVLTGVAGWRIAACALAGFELRQDMRTSRRKSQAESG